MSSKVLCIALVALVICGIAVAIAFRDQLNPTAMEQWIGRFGMAGPPTCRSRSWPTWSIARWP